MNAVIEGAERDLRSIAEQMGIKVDGRWSDQRIQEEIDKAEVDVLKPPSKEAVERSESRIEDMSRKAQAQWEGQSPVLGMAERVGRIRAALKKHGFDDILDHVLIDTSKNPCMSEKHRALDYKTFL